MTNEHDIYERSLRDKDFANKVQQLADRIANAICPVMEDQDISVCLNALIWFMATFIHNTVMDNRDIRTAIMLYTANEIGKYVKVMEEKDQE